MQVFLYFLGTVMIGGLLGWYAASAADGWGILVPLAELWSAYYLHVLLHEAGHLLCGRLCGYTLTSFRIGKWMLVRREGRWTISRFHIPGTGGQCLMCPPEGDDSPIVLYNLGGGLLNLVTAAPDPALWAQGQWIEAEGEVRSYNNRSGQGSKLVITVLVRSARPAPMEEGENRLALAGALCRKPVVRRTPLGREICDLLLAVNRRYRRADYLPCIAWGSLAHQCGQMEVGGRLRLEGRLQSRTYTKVLPEGTQERVAYEISVMGLSPAPEPETEPA